MAFLFTTLFSKCLVDNCFRRLRAFFQVKKHFCFFSSKKHFSDHQCRAASLRRFSKKLAYIFSNGSPRISWKLTRTVQGTGLKRHCNKNYLESLTDFSSTKKVVIGKMEISLKNIHSQTIPCTAKLANVIYQNLWQ